MDIATFIAFRPEFAEVDATVIQSALDEASRRTPSSVWGTFTDDGVSLLAADIITESPMGGATRLQPGDTSTYRRRYDELAEIVGCGAFLVAGGC